MSEPATTTAVLPPASAGRAIRALDALHAALYFAPELGEELVAIGVRPGRMTYFAGRSAALGPVGPGVVAATFYNFDPELVARHIPRAWTLATPSAIIAARFRAADRMLRRLLGDAVDSADVHELGRLTRAASEHLDPAGRPLFAGHAEQDGPTEPHLALWWAITLLREHRGDAHVAALVAAGIGGLDALILHTATGRGFTEDTAKASRGWSDEQWNTALAGLRGRGLVDDDLGLTQAGAELRAGVETVTDLASLTPWAALGAESTHRVIELGTVLSRRAVAAGAFPAGVFASGR